MKKTIVNENMLGKEEVFFSRVPSPEQKGCKLVRVAYERWRPEFHPRGGNKGVNTIFLVAGGKGFHCADGVTGGLEPGSVILSPIDEGAEIWSVPQTPLIMMLMAFTGQDSLSTCRRLLGSDRKLFTLYNHVEVLELMQNILRKAQQSSALCEEICNTYLPVLLTTMREGMQGGQNHDPMARSSFVTCKRYLDQNFEVIRSIEQAAGQCHVSAGYMSQLFRRFADTTPSDYLQRLKINLAAHQLQNSKLTVQEVSDRIGYANQYAFSKAFKRVMGIAPKFYRQGREG